MLRKEARLAEMARDGHFRAARTRKVRRTDATKQRKTREAQRAICLGRTFFSLVFFVRAKKSNSPLGAKPFVRTKKSNSPLGAKPFVRTKKSNSLKLPEGQQRKCSCHAPKGQQRKCSCHAPKGQQRKCSCHAPEGRNTIPSPRNCEAAPTESDAEASAKPWPQSAESAHE